MAECRICLGDEDTVRDPLLQACACTGAIHLKCLQEWAMRRTADTVEAAMVCELCTQPYRVHHTTAFGPTRASMMSSRSQRCVVEFAVLGLTVLCGWGVYDEMGDYLDATMAGENRQWMWCSTASACVGIAAQLFALVWCVGAWMDENSRVVCVPDPGAYYKGRGKPPAAGRGGGCCVRLRVRPAEQRGGAGAEVVEL